MDNLQLRGYLSDAFSKGFDDAICHLTDGDIYGYHKRLATARAFGIFLEKNEKVDLCDTLFDVSIAMGRINANEVKNWKKYGEEVVSFFMCIEEQGREFIDKEIEKQNGIE